MPAMEAVLARRDYRHVQKRVVRIWSLGEGAMGPFVKMLLALWEKIAC